MEEQLDSLEAIVAPDEPSAGDGKLQWELTAPLQTGAACIGIGLALEQQSHRTDVSLPHCLMKCMLPRACMPALERRAQQLHRMLLDSLIDIVLHLLGPLPRAWPQRSANGDDLGRRCGYKARQRIAGQ
jgi:hypothetical protein